MQWNLYEITTKFDGLERQVVFYNREGKYDFVKTVPGKQQHMCFSDTIPQNHWTGFAVYVLGNWVIIG